MIKKSVLKCSVVAFGSTWFQTDISSVVQSYLESVSDHMLLCYKRRHTPRNSILQSHQSSQVVPITWVVPRTGPQQPQPCPPAELPQVDEHGVGQQTRWQWVLLSQQSASQALHEVYRNGVHRQRPQAAVTCQPSVLSAAPVPHGSEGHLTEAAMQRIHIEAHCSRERTAWDALVWLCWGFILNTRPCHTGNC